MRSGFDDFVVRATLSLLEADGQADRQAELEHATWHLKGTIMELKCSVTKALRRGGHPVTLQLKRFLCADEDSCTCPNQPSFAGQPKPGRAA